MALVALLIRSIAAGHSHRISRGSLQTGLESRMQLACLYICTPSKEGNGGDTGENMKREGENTRVFAKTEMCAVTSSEVA